MTKTYVVRVEGVPSVRDLRSLTEGIELEDGPATARSARRLDAFGDESLVEIVMTEGRKREVRRMLTHIGYPVVRLARVAIGPLRDRDLPPGEARPLTIDEVRLLYAAARMGD